MIAMTLAGLGMNTGVADAEGALWYVTGWEGWDSPPMRQGTLEPSGKDGTIITDSQYGPRSISLTGTCKAVGEAGFWSARDTIMNLMTPTAKADFVVSETVDKTCSVKRTGNWKIRDLYGSSFEWTIELLAEDPRKYAVTPTIVIIGAGVSRVITPTGKASTYPTLVTSGATLATHVGQGLYVGTKAGASLSSGTEIDMRKRTVYAGSTNQLDKISSTSAWWALLRGSNTIANGGANSITLTYRDAWI